MSRFDGNVIIVTGGARDIGKAFCERFRTEGATVVVADVDLAAAGQVASALGAPETSLAVGVDVASGEQVRGMVDQSLKAFGQIDVLINNAGIYPMRGFLEITEEEWDRLLGTNLKGTFLCAQAVSRHMVERRTGRIVNIASSTFVSVPTASAHYIASKGGVIGLTRAMARELGPYGINVNCIAPGLTATETALSMRGEASFALSRAGRAIARDEYPEDLVGAAVFFASPDSAFITGQTLIVEGGRNFV